MDSKLYTKAIDALRQVNDPEVGMNIVKMGLIHSLEVTYTSAKLVMIATSPSCPMGTMLKDTARAALAGALGDDVEVDVVLDLNIPWNEDLMLEGEEEVEAIAAPITPIAIGRIPFLLVAIMSLIVGFALGLQRTGLSFSIFGNPSLMMHGPLVIGGFFGAVIGLERAVALPWKWCWFAPALMGLSAPVTLILGVEIGAPLLTVGSAIFLLTNIVLTYKHQTLFNMAMAVAALLFQLGNVAWLLGASIPNVVQFWASFLVLTIVGERLELSRLGSKHRFKNSGFIIASMPLVIAPVMTLNGMASGAYIMSIGCFLLTIWLLKFDLARSTIYKGKITSFVSIALLSGYGWLAVAGFGWAIFGNQSAGLYYDATLHSLFLGFVFSMILGHAPIIFPAILKTPMPYNHYMYAPLVILHLGVAFRVLGGFSGYLEVRRYSAIMNATAIGLFFLIVILTVINGRRSNSQAQG
jgi:metal-sulfur cluster biosynthetic enzyme